MLNWIRKDGKRVLKKWEMVRDEIQSKFLVGNIA